MLFRSANREKHHMFDEFIEFHLDKMELGEEPIICDREMSQEAFIKERVSFSLATKNKIGKRLGLQFPASNYEESYVAYIADDFTDYYTPMHLFRTVFSEIGSRIMREKLGVLFEVCSNQEGIILGILQQLGYLEPI